MLEVNSYVLINKCSTFVLFDLIRKCGRQPSDYRQTTAEKRLQRSNGDYRESNTTTETTRAIEARGTVVAQFNKYSKHTTAHNGKCEKSEMIVTIKCET